MKKILFAAMALGMCMTSCMNEEFPNANYYGQLNVNVSNDVQMNTRAAGPVEDLTDWTVSATGPETYNDVKNATKVKAGTYTVRAYNYASLDDALAANNFWGDAYYTGSVNGVEISAGEVESVTIDCGKAQNARLKVEFNLVSNFTNYSLTVMRDENALVFNNTNALAGMENPALAYFAASKLNEAGNIDEERKTVVSYTLCYTYGSEEKEISSSIVLGGPATENIITVSSNDNATITVTVNYDKTFTTGMEQEYTFDAATGEQIN